MSVKVQAYTVPHLKSPRSRYLEFKGLHCDITFTLFYVDLKKPTLLTFFKGASTALYFQGFMSKSINLHIFQTYFADSVSSKMN